MRPIAGNALHNHITTVSHECEPPTHPPIQQKVVDWFESTPDQGGVRALLGDVNTVALALAYHLGANLQSVGPHLVVRQQARRITLCATTFSHLSHPNELVMRLATPAGSALVHRCMAACLSELGARR